LILKISVDAPRLVCLLLEIDKFDICVRTCVRAHYAHIRARVMNSTDDLLHDPSDAGRFIDGAGDLIVRASSGSGREGSWFQYHPHSNHLIQGASAFAPHADGHVAGRVALSERFEIFRRWAAFTTLI
jgi:hypothetical protein